MSDPFYWKEAVVALAYVHQRIREVDVEGLWSPSLPNVAASEADILAAERALDRRLDRRYRAFLQVADGWDGFFQAVDLFGTSDLKGSARKRDADRKLEVLDETGVLREARLDVKHVLAIAAAPQDRDVFVLVLSPGESAGAVVWMSGGAGLIRS